MTKALLQETITKLAHRYGEQLTLVVSPEHWEKVRSLSTIGTLVLGGETVKILVVEKLEKPKLLIQIVETHKG